MSGKAGRRSPILGAAIIAASFLVGGYFLITDLNERQKAEIARLEGIADKLRSESVPLKFKILGRGEGGVRVRLRLYDLAGREVALLERTLPGSSVFIDVLLAPLAPDSRDAGPGGSYLAFPYRVFTDELSPASGERLLGAYDSGGFPRVMDGVEWSRAERAAIAEAFRSALASEAAGEPATGSSAGAFGSAVHEAAGVSRLEVGVVYKVVCRAKGGVEIMED